jgi:hypothetical protein
MSVTKDHGHSIPPWKRDCLNDNCQKTVTCIYIPIALLIVKDDVHSNNTSPITTTSNPLPFSPTPSCLHDTTKKWSIPPLWLSPLPFTLPDGLPRTVSPKAPWLRVWLRGVPRIPRLAGFLQSRAWPPTLGSSNVFPLFHSEADNSNAAGAKAKTTGA